MLPTDTRTPYLTCSLSSVNSTGLLRPVVHSRKVDTHLPLAYGGGRKENQYFWDRERCWKGGRGKVYCKPREKRAAASVAASQNTGIAINLATSSLPIAFSLSVPHLLILLLPALTPCLDPEGMFDGSFAAWTADLPLADGAGR